MSESKKHPYHLVDPSPWPLLTCLSLLILVIGAILWMHNIGGDSSYTPKIVFFIGALMLIGVSGAWFTDIAKEGNTKGTHTKEVRAGLRFGMGLFIVSEVMFFAAFFGAYFYAALLPSAEIGGVWPPKGVQSMDPFELPYFNTLLLLFSGTTLTWAHHELVNSKSKPFLQGLAITVGLGALFTVVQGLEYSHATFGFTDGVYSSNFYMATGFHGFHVIIGTLFLCVCLWRGYRNEFTAKQHVGFEAAAWYWHFVDVVWLFLFVSIYWFGYRPTP